ncbi:hypothetical protein [Actinoplanes sp. NBRC 103695]|uniref:hypothetical protein n=1 Tax=Actinoplanes sp. NBRC 103695 TaxID=3032202 RepID=UPI0025535483|nr:hypothetical protein [Actinoplanes sp. NBRC 103695]
MMASSRRRLVMRVIVILIAAAGVTGFAGDNARQQRPARPGSAALNGDPGRLTLAQTAVTLPVHR